jgi:hypothetical protein
LNLRAFFFKEKKVMPSTVSLTPLFDLGASALCSMLIIGDRAGQAHGGHVESLADVV